MSPFDPILEQRLVRLGGLIAATLLASGCEVTTRYDVPLKTRSHTVFEEAPAIPSYHQQLAGIPFRRVAILPLFFSQGTESELPEMDKELHAELTKTSLFEVTQVTRSQLSALFGFEQIASTEVIPRDFLPRLMARYGVDALFFTDVTHYHPYQPIAIGLRSKLVDGRTGQIRWTFDHLFDSGSPDVAKAARKHYFAESQTNLPIRLDGGSALLSPNRFLKFVAAETFLSLREKPVPEVPYTQTARTVVPTPPRMAGGPPPSR
jgi:hypothetical protein